MFMDVKERRIFRNFAGDILSLRKFTSPPPFFYSPLLFLRHYDLLLYFRAAALCPRITFFFSPLHSSVRQKLYFRHNSLRSPITIFAPKLYFSPLYFFTPLLFFYAAIILVRRHSLFYAPLLPKLYAESLRVPLLYFRTYSCFANTLSTILFFTPILYFRHYSHCSRITIFAPILYFSPL